MGRERGAEGGSPVGRMPAAGAEERPAEATRATGADAPIENDPPDQWQQEPGPEGLGPAHERPSDYAKNTDEVESSQEGAADTPAVQGDAPDSSAMTDQPNHSGRVSSWVCVVAMIAGAVVIGLGMVLTSIPWVIAGVVLVALGGIAAVVLRINKDSVVDTTQVHRAGTASERSAASDPGHGVPERPGSNEVKSQ